MIHFLVSAPLYPTSAHRNRRSRQDYLTQLNFILASSRSARSAGCSLAFIASPFIPTKRWGLRPFVFLALS